MKRRSFLATLIVPLTAPILLALGVDPSFTCTPKWAPGNTILTPAEITRKSVLILRENLKIIDARRNSTAG